MVLAGRVVLIEQATAQDLDAVIRIAQVNLTEHYEDALFFSMLDLSPDTFLVAREGPLGDVAGFVLAVRQTSLEARLIVIAVDAPYQGRNIGRRLLDEVERRLVRKGVLELSLEVREENLRAITFYRRAGYEIRGGVPRYYSDGARAVMMGKGL